jgi:hypothetical protein
MSGDLDVGFWHYVPMEISVAVTPGGGLGGGIGMPPIALVGANIHVTDTNATSTSLLGEYGTSKGISTLFGGVETIAGFDSYDFAVASMMGSTRTPVYTGTQVNYGVSSAVVSAHCDITYSYRATLKLPWHPQADWFWWMPW